MDLAIMEQVLKESFDNKKRRQQPMKKLMKQRNWYSKIWKLWIKNWTH